MSEKLSAFDVIVAQLVAQGVDAAAARIMAENSLKGVTTLADQSRLPNGKTVISIETKRGGINLDGK